MAKNKNKLKKLKGKFGKKGDDLRKQLKSAISDNKITKKDVKALAKAGASTKQLNALRKTVDKKKSLSIGKKVDTKKDTNTIKANVSRKAFVDKVAEKADLSKKQTKALNAALKDDKNKNLSITKSDITSLKDAGLSTKQLKAITKTSSKDSNVSIGEKVTNEFIKGPSRTEVAEAVDSLSNATLNADELGFKTIDELIANLTPENIVKLNEALGNGTQLTSSDLERADLLDSNGDVITIDNDVDPGGGQLDSVLGNTPEFKAGSGTNSGFGALSKELAEKAQTYVDAFDPTSDYMKRLKEGTLERMQIDPSEYDRMSKADADSLSEKLKDPSSPGYDKAVKEFEDLDLAEQYDLKSGLMFKRLNQPLKDAVSGLNENLSNFDVGSKGNIKGITFKEDKLDAYKTSDSKMAQSIIDQAKSLGVKNVAGVAGLNGRMDRINSIVQNIGTTNTKLQEGSKGFLQAIKDTTFQSAGFNLDKFESDAAKISDKLFYNEKYKENKDLPSLDLKINNVERINNIKKQEYDGDYYNPPHEGNIPMPGITKRGVEKISDYYGFDPLA